MKYLLPFRLSMLTFLLLFFVLPSVRSIDAQSDIRAYYTIQHTNPYIGEPFPILLTIESSTPILLIEEPPLDDDQRLEMVADDESAITEPATKIERQYTGRLWRTGAYLSPERIVIVQDNTGALIQVPIASFHVDVPTAIEDPATATLRPPLPVISIPFTPAWWYAAGIVIVTVLASALLYAMIQLSRRRQGQSQADTPGQTALNLLESLKSQQQSPAELYPIVALIIRNYIQQQWNISAVEMTTSELNQTLRDMNITNQALRQQIAQFLGQADLVKFAQYEPEFTSQRLLGFASYWIKAANTSLQAQDG